MRWPLRYQLLLPLVGLILAALGAVSLSTAWLSTHRVRAQIEEQLADVVRTLSAANFPLEPTVLRQTRGLSGAEYVVSETSGRIVAASDEAFTRLPEGAQVQDWRKLALERTVQVGKERYFYAPVELDRRPVGGKLALLHIFYPERSWSDARRQAVYPPLAIGAAALLVAVLVAILVAARVTRPIDKLQSQVARISQGDFQPLPVPMRNDEIRDLAEAINRMAQMLARYEDQVRRAERLRTLGQLGGGIAHQLRNAATGCRMALDLHRRDCPAGVDFESLDVAARQLTLMEKYLQRFLTLGRPSVTQRAAVNLVELVESVLPLVRPSAQHVGVELEFAAPAEAVFVQGDAEALEQLLVNLLLNGVEAAASVCADPAPMIARPRVDVCLSREGERVQLEVRDSGPGPDPAVGADLFEPLVTEKPDGTGLGLSVAREIAQQHGGTIRWGRREGMTCFVVELRLQ